MVNFNFFLSLRTCHSRDLEGRVVRCCTPTHVYTRTHKYAYYVPPTTRRARRMYVRNAHYRIFGYFLEIFWILPVVCLGHTPFLIFCVSCTPETIRGAPPTLQFATPGITSVSRTSAESSAKHPSFVCV